MHVQGISWRMISLIAQLFLLGAISCGTLGKRNNLSQAAVEADAQALFEEYWQDALRSDPEYATTIGQHAYNDKLTVCNVQCHEQRKRTLDGFIRRAKQMLPLATEGSKTQNNLQVFIMQVSYQLDMLLIGNHLLAISYLSGPQTDFLFLLDEVPMKTKQDCLNLISRYNMFPQQIEAKIDLLNEGIKKGITQHERSLKNLEKSFASFDVPPETSPFYEPFKNIAGVGTAEEVQSIQRSAKNAIKEKIIPGFKRLSEYIKNVYRKHTRFGVGVSSATNGNEFYSRILNFHATANVTPEAIHNLGLREVARIKGEMQAVIKALGYSLTPQQFNERLRSNDSLYFSSREEAIEAYRDVMMNKIKPKLTTLFKTIPKEPLEIKHAPDFMAGGPLAYYMPGSGKNNGTFYLDTSNLKNLPKYETVTLSLHEGIPGHHFQIAFAKEQDWLPNFRRYVMGGLNNAFIEGWALYAEYLGNEMGLFGDNYMLYGHLSEEIFRACRLVVDTGIHSLGWSRQAAINYMAQNSASTLGNIQNEIDRYITWPGQACSYKYGEVKIKKLRRDAESALGGKFDVREFHDTVLRSIGPMSFVELQVQRYIKTTTRSL